MSLRRPSASTDQARSRTASFAIASLIVRPATPRSSRLGPGPDRSSRRSGSPARTGPDRPTRPRDPRSADLVDERHDQRVAATAATGLSEGVMYYDKDLHLIRYYNNTDQWVNLTGVGGGVCGKQSGTTFIT